MNKKLIFSFLVIIILVVVLVILTNASKSPVSIGTKISPSIKRVADDYFQLIMQGNKILIEISYCNLHTMENRNKILVDPTNGDIVWRGENLECQGII